MQRVLERRFTDLREDLGGNDPPWVAVYCSGCGLIEGDTSLELLMPKVKGWEIADTFDGQDLCPRCRDKGQGWAGSFPSRR